MKNVQKGIKSRELLSAKWQFSVYDCCCCCCRVFCAHVDTICAFITSPSAYTHTYSHNQNKRNRWKKNKWTITILLCVCVCVYFPKFSCERNQKLQCSDSERCEIIGIIADFSASFMPNLFYFSIDTLHSFLHLFARNLLACCSIHNFNRINTMKSVCCCCCCFVSLSIGIRVILSVPLIITANREWVRESRNKSFQLNIVRTSFSINTQNREATWIMFNRSPWTSSIKLRLIMNLITYRECKLQFPSI